MGRKKERPSVETERLQVEMEPQTAQKCPEAGRGAEFKRIRPDTNCETPAREGDRDPAHTNPFKTQTNRQLPEPTQIH